VLHITLDDEQASVVASSHEPLEVRDTSGRIVGVLQPASADELAIVAEARRRSASTTRWHSTAEVRERLRSLDGR
jgi:hypothetical protein